MELYHGSTYIVDVPNLERLNNKTDFGKGFYTTTNIELADQISFHTLKALECIKYKETIEVK